jgi:hypothetical protein
VQPLLVSQHVGLEVLDGHLRRRKFVVRVTVVGDDVPGLAPGGHRRQTGRRINALSATNSTLFTFAPATPPGFASFSATATASPLTKSVRRRT